MGSKSKKITAGFRYFMGIHMGLGRGPIDEICEIKVGDRQAWVGSQTEPGTIKINAPELFGGDKAEGGIKGDLQVLMGGASQVPTQELRDMLSDNQVPGFRGVVTTFFDGMICAMNPYPKAWKYRVRRILKGWHNDAPWYPAKAVIEMEGSAPEEGTRTIKAMNPAHIIYQCLTDPSWGRGLDPARIDSQSFRDAADKLYDEGFGLCLRWTRTNTIDQFVQLVIDHISGVLYPDKFSGLFVLKLLRYDYDVSTLPEYGTHNGLLQIQEVTNASPAAIVNELVVKWHNPINNSASSTRVQNLAGQLSGGGSVSAELEYLGIPTATLANRVAQRDLKTSSTNLRRFRATADRRLWWIRPGSVIKVNEPTRGVGQLVLRVATVEDGVATDGTITFSAVQDMFSFNISTFTGVQPPTHQNPDFTPQARRQLVYEKPYVELNREYPLAEFQALPNTACVYSHHMDRATPLCQVFESTVQLLDNPEYFNRDNWGNFTPICTITGTIDYLTNTVGYTEGDLMDEVIVGSYALIEEEFIKITGINEETRQLTFERGTIDTVPARHLAGNEIWFVPEDGTSDLVNYAPGETLVLTGIPFTMRGGSMDDDLAPQSVLEMKYRFFRPYPPGKVFWETLSTPKTNWFNPVVMRHDVGGTSEVDPSDPQAPPIYTEAPDFLTLSWAHRDRLLQADQLIRHQEDNIGPEPGTQYRIEVKDGEGTVVRSVTVSGTEWVYTYGMAENDLQLNMQASDPVPATITLFAIRDTLLSWQGYTMFLNVFKRPDAPLMQMNMVMNFNQVSSEEPAEPAAEGLIAPMSYSTVSSEEPAQDITGLYVTQESNAVAAEDAYPAQFRSVVVETPYMQRLRDGNSPADPSISVFVSGPEDKIVDLYTLRDRVADYTNPDAAYSDQGLYGFSAWIDLVGTGIFSQTVAVQFELVKRRTGTRPDGTPVYTWVPDPTKPMTSERVGAPTPVVIEPGSIGIFGKEVVEITAVTRNQYGISHVEINRGCVDTIPQVQGAGRLWIFGDSTARSNTVYPAGSVAQYVLDPFVDGPKPSLSEMSAGYLAILERAKRPYPPGLVLTCGEHWFNSRAGYAAGSGALEVTWAYRNRPVQADEVYDHFDVGLPWENGVEYVLELYGYKGETLKTWKTAGTGITLPEEEVIEASKAYYATTPPPTTIEDGITVTLPKPAWPGFGLVPFRLYSALGAYPSWQGYVFDIFYDPEGIGGEVPPGPGDGTGGGSSGGGGGTGGNGSGGTTPGSGGSTPGGGTTNPPIDPPDPIDPSNPPEFPDTDQPEPTDPVVPVDPDNTSGWGENWSNGWNEGEAP